jgi:hypothetical protein
MKFHQNNLFKKNKGLLDISIHIFTFHNCLYFSRFFKIFCGVLLTAEFCHDPHGVHRLVRPCFIPKQHSWEFCNVFSLHTFHYVAYSGRSICLLKFSNKLCTSIVTHISHIVWHTARAIRTTDHTYIDKKVNDVRRPTKNVLLSKHHTYWTTTITRQCVPCAIPLY